MTDLNFEVARACLVIGLVFTAFIYSRTGIASGGAVTGSYLSFLVITQQWQDIIGWFVLAFAGMFTIRLFANRWPLSRTWLYYLGVSVPALIHVVLSSIGELPSIGMGLSAFLTAGLYVTNGLTAYDMQRQGVWKTVASIAAVVALTLAVVIPINLLQPHPQVTGQQIAYFTPHAPALILICILAAAAVHLGLGWGTAGIIGGLFLINILNVQSMIVFFAITFVGGVIARWASNRMSLSPRKRLYSILAVGSITSWFGLFWLNWLGLPGAEFESQFGVETLLVIGLLVSEIVRLGPAKAYGGASIVIAITAVTSWAYNAGEYWAIGLCTAAIVALLVVGWRTQRKLWGQALVAGDRWTVMRVNGLY